MTIRKTIVMRWLAACGLVLAAAIGCVELKEFVAPQPPTVGAEWRELLDELREFERQIGFRPTKNFATLATDRQGRWPEPGWLLQGVERELALALARGFGQRAIVFGQRECAGLLIAATERWLIRPLEIQPADGCPGR